MNSICAIASIDLKQFEPGLLEYAASKGITPVFYTAEELASLEGDFEESEFVKKTAGIGNVCERAAAFAGGELIIRKSSYDGVTVAAAAHERRIEF